MEQNPNLRAKSPDSMLEQKPSDIPLSTLCATCQSLFSRPNDDREEGARVEFDEDMPAIFEESCSICATIRTSEDHRVLSRSLFLLPDPEHVTVSIWGLWSNIRYPDGVVRFVRQMEFYPSRYPANTPAIEIVPHRDRLRRSSLPINSGIFSTNTADETCFQMIKRWVHTCLHEHKLCRQIRNTEEFSRLPTRLIDVRGKPRLIVTASCNIDSSTVYATLSHRWVEGCNIKLLRSNLDRLQQSIEPNDLSSVFQDSIVATRRLGIDYIWIDALCIVQDDPEEWKHESSIMGAVYQNAILNFGASAAARAQSCQKQSSFDPPPSGLFVSRLPSELSMSHVEILRQGLRQKVFGYAPHVSPRKHSSSPIMQRGWILQERVLSPRSIYFERQLYWECSEFLANESFPEGCPETIYMAPWGQHEPVRLPLLIERPRYETIKYDNGLEIKDIYRTWLHLVEEYRHCELTFQSDVLHALSGLATCFNNELEDVYLAGLWRQDLIRGLLWNRCLSHCGRIASRPLEKYRAPSWSWAASNLSVQYPHIDVSWSWEEAFVAEIHEAKTELTSSNSTGLVSGGFIRLSGHLRPNQNVTGEHLEYLVAGTVPMFFEAYDFEHDEHGVSWKNSFFLVLTLYSEDVPSEEMTLVRGLILKPTGHNPDEFRRVGAFALHPTRRPEFVDLVKGNFDKQCITIV